jgi:hypothetical protein
MPMKLDRAYIKVTKKLAEIARDGINIPREETKIIANEMARKIRVRTRLGRGIDEGKLKVFNTKTGRNKTVKTSTYIEQRRRWKERGMLSDFTEPEKSNLTRTGQLLESLYGKSDRMNEFTIAVKEKRIASDVTNSDIIRYQDTQGRKFFGFSKPEIAFIQQQVLKYFKRVFKL